MFAVIVWSVRRNCWLTLQSALTYADALRLKCAQSSAVRPHVVRAS